MLAIGNDDDGNDCDAGIGSVQGQNERENDRYSRERTGIGQTDREKGWRKGMERVLREGSFSVDCRYPRLRCARCSTTSAWSSHLRNGVVHG